MRQLPRPAREGEAAAKPNYPWTPPTDSEPRKPRTPQTRSEPGKARTPIHNCEPNKHWTPRVAVRAVCSTKSEFPMRTPPPERGSHTNSELRHGPASPPTPGLLTGIASRMLHALRNRPASRRMAGIQSPTARGSRTKSAPHNCRASHRASEVQSGTASHTRLGIQSPDAPFAPRGAVTTMKPNHNSGGGA